MNDDDKSSLLKISKNNNKKNGYSIASLLLSATPVAILVIGFLFCLIVSGGGTSDNDLGAVWWLFVVLIWVLIPITIIVNIFSVFVGIKGLKVKRGLFSWAGIIIVLFEITVIIMIFAITTILDMPEKNARKQEINQLQQEISNYETYVDLTPFDLGIYKLKEDGDKYLWDITKPEDNVIEYDGVKMVYENHFNRRDDEGFDNTWGNSNEGKDVQYDVYFYENTYIIVTPLWDKPGTLYYWGYIYLCKDINKDVDLFEVGILDLKVIEKLQVLSGKEYSRKEITEKLGKTF